MAVQVNESVIDHALDSLLLGESEVDLPSLREDDLPGGPADSSRLVGIQRLHDHDIAQPFYPGLIAC